MKYFEIQFEILLHISISFPISYKCNKLILIVYFKNATRYNLNSIYFCSGLRKSFIGLFEGSIKNPEIDSTSAGSQKEKIVCD